MPFKYKNGAYGGMAGSKEGVIINEQNWLIKYPNVVYEDFIWIKYDDEDIRWEDVKIRG